jgi:hypothetical protein
MENSNHLWAFLVIALIAGVSIGFVVSNNNMTGNAFLGFGQKTATVATATPKCSGNTFVFPTQIATEFTEAKTTLDALITYRNQLAVKNKVFMVLPDEKIFTSEDGSTIYTIRWKGSGTTNTNMAESTGLAVMCSCEMSSTGKCSWSEPGNSAYRECTSTTNCPCTVTTTPF